MKRSEMKIGTFVKFRGNKDDGSLYNKLFSNRYLMIHSIAEQPDHFAWWGMSSGAVCYYSLHHMRQFSNTNVYPISDEETGRLIDVLNNGDKYKDLYDISIVVNKEISILESALESYFPAASDFDFWDCEDEEHFSLMLLEEIECTMNYSSLSKEEQSEIDSDMNEVLDLFGKICQNVDRITALENKYIRSGDNNAYSEM